LEVNMAQEPVYWIGGDKGGIGKSTVAAALTDHLVASQKKVMLVDTDKQADLWKTYHKDVPSELVNLEEHDEWIRLASIIAANPDSTFVINSAAGCQAHIERSGRRFMNALKALERKMITFWLVDRKRDSLEALARYLESTPDSEMIAVRNLYAGAEKKFELFNNSNTKKALEKKGGKTINFPEVADRVTDAMNRDRLTVEKALTELPFGDRIELEGWREDYRAVFSQVIG
jgi:AAA domain